MSYDDRGRLWFEWKTLLLIDMLDRLISEQCTFHCLFVERPMRATPGLYIHQQPYISLHRPQTLRLGNDDGTRLSR